MCAAVAAMASCMIGYDSAFIGGTLALDSFRDEFHFSDYSTTKVNFITANIVSCYQAGAFFGAFGAYPAGHFWGRKIGLQIFSAIFVVGAGLQLGATGSTGLAIMYFGRALAVSFERFRTKTFQGTNYVQRDSVSVVLAI